MRFKKIIIIIIFGFLCTMLPGCKTINENKKEFNIIVPEGMPYIAIGNLIGEKNITINNVSGSTALKAAFTSNDYDIIIAPFNLGVQLYNGNKSTYKIDSIIGLNNLYLISQENIEFNDIKDVLNFEQSILAFGEGSIPDIVLKKVLELNNIDKQIEYMNSVNDVMPYFVQKKYDFVLSSEPVLTIMKHNKNLKFNSLNLQNYISTKILQVAVFVKDGVDINEIDEVLEKIKSNIESMNNNYEQYANNLVLKNDYFSEMGYDVLVECEKNGNIQYIKAKDFKSEIESFLTLINYKLPDEKFYR